MSSFIQNFLKVSQPVLSEPVLVANITECPSLKTLLFASLKESTFSVFSTLTFPFLYIFKWIFKVLAYTYGIFLGIQTSFYAISYRAVTFLDVSNLAAQTAFGHAKTLVNGLLWATTSTVKDKTTEFVNSNSAKSTLFAVAVVSFLLFAYFALYAILDYTKGKDVEPEDVEDEVDEPQEVIKPTKTTKVTTTACGHKNCTDKCKWKTTKVIKWKNNISNSCGHKNCQTVCRWKKA